MAPCLKNKIIRKSGVGGGGKVKEGREEIRGEEDTDGEEREGRKACCDLGRSGMNGKNRPQNR